MESTFLKALKRGKLFIVSVTEEEYERFGREVNRNGYAILSKTVIERRQLYLTFTYKERNHVPDKLVKMFVEEGYFAYSKNAKGYRVWWRNYDTGKKFVQTDHPDKLKDNGYVYGNVKREDAWQSIFKSFFNPTHFIVLEIPYKK